MSWPRPFHLTHSGESILLFCCQWLEESPLQLPASAGSQERAGKCLYMAKGEGGGECWRPFHWRGLIPRHSSMLSWDEGPWLVTSHKWGPSFRQLTSNLLLAFHTNQASNSTHTHTQSSLDFEYFLKTILHSGSHVTTEPLVVWVIKKSYNLWEHVSK